MAAVGRGCGEQLRQRIAALLSGDELAPPASDRLAFRGLTSIEARGKELSVQIDADGRSWALMVDLLQRYDLAAHWDPDQRRVLIAATDNEAYNTLVCSEFAPEIGTDRVYQLGEGGDSDDPRAIPDSLRGRALFSSGFGVDDVQQRQEEGWEFRRTKLSEKYKLEDARDNLPEATNMLLLVEPNGDLRFFTHAAAPEPKAGDTIVSYSPPRSDKPKEQAARRAARNGSKPQPA